MSNCDYNNDGLLDDIDVQIYNAFLLAKIKYGTSTPSVAQVQERFGAIYINLGKAAPTVIVEHVPDSESQFYKTSTLDATDRIIYQSYVYSLNTYGSSPTIANVQQKYDDIYVTRGISPAVIITKIPTLDEMSSESSASSLSSISSISSQSTSSISSASTSSISSQSSNICPNNITLLDTTIHPDNIMFTINSQLNVSINAGGNTDYILLYDGDISGQPYDNNNRFYGNVTGYNDQTLTSNGFISIILNGTSYYMPKYTGSEQTDCKSNIVGTVLPETGYDYDLSGYVLIKINGNQYKYTPVFTGVEDLSSSSSTISSTSTFIKSSSSSSSSSSTRSSMSSISSVSSLSSQSSSSSTSSSNSSSTSSMSSNSSSTSSNSSSSSSQSKSSSSYSTSSSKTESYSSESSSSNTVSSDSSSSNSGTFWTLPATMPTGKSWTSSAISYSGQYMFTGWYFSGRIYSSSDYGVNWAEVRPAGDVNKAFYTIACSHSGQYVITGDFGDGRLYTSNNYGATGSWTERQPVGNVGKKWRTCSIGATGAFMIAATYDNAASGNTGRIYMSNDYGATWIETKPAGNVNKLWNVVACDDDGSHIIIGASSGRIYWSNDRGETWTEKQPQGDANIQYQEGVCMDNDGSFAMISAYGGRVYKTTDSGANWAELAPNGNFANNNWRRSSCSYDGRVIIINSGAGRPYISWNSGTSWTVQNPFGGTSNYDWQPCSVSRQGNYFLTGQNSGDGRVYLGYRW